MRGILFADYVRMIRGTKHVDWSKSLLPDDLELARQRIDPDAWYPMETFERFGIGILREVAQGQIEAVQMWGRFQVDTVRAAFPNLIAPSPSETLMRFQVLRRTFFDYDALDVRGVHDVGAAIHVAYGMSHVAEEAASNQTLGFFERLVQESGADTVYARFSQKSWEGAPITRIELDWN